jgi:glutamyl-tRNA synthetase
MPDEGEARFRDIVRGDFKIANTELDDFVLIKTDGLPTYNFAVVVDDARMKISHVIRGDDHLSNTPRQVHVYLALGYRVPKFAHLPMILGADRTRLSKRHGATSIDWYREQHYLPDAMVNYLALLGWSFNDRQELFSRSALIDKFTLKKVSKNPAMFDNDKMEYVNAEHFKMLSPMRKVIELYRVLKSAGYIPGDFHVDLERPVDLKLVPGTEPVAENGEEARLTEDEEMKRLYLIVSALGNRLKLLKDAPGQVAYFFKDDYEVDDSAVKTHLMRPEIPERLGRLADAFETLNWFKKEGVEESLRALADEMELQAGELIHPARVALTGGTVSPDIFQVIELLGKDKTVERLRKAAGLARG